MNTDKIEMTDQEREAFRTTIAVLKRRGEEALAEIGLDTGDLEDVLDYPVGRSNAGKRALMARVREHVGGDKQEAYEKFRDAFHVIRALHGFEGRDGVLAVLGRATGDLVENEDGDLVEVSR
jgi:hypothetical protein